MTGKDAQNEPRSGRVLSAILKNRLITTSITPFIAGTVLTILAPLGTHNFDLGWRAFYWISLCFAGGFGAMAAHLVMTHLAPHITDWRHFVVQSLGSTLFVAPFVIGGVGSLNLAGTALTLFYIWVIAIVITSVAELAARAKQPELSEKPDLPVRAPIMDRLPVNLQTADFYAAMSEDHYVRIYTSRGDHLVLMRLSDVPDLAQSLPGLSPHRSWWVAEQGVKTVSRKSGKTQLTLKSGEIVPVSRSGQQRIRDAGWLGQR